MTPHVTCVCLTADRQQYTDRAVGLFLAQSYPNKSLLVLDNGNVPYELPFTHPDIRISRIIMQPKSIGALRNIANRKTAEDAYAQPPAGDIIAHWDSDDYSHPLRLAWQVAHLKDSGKQVVGYRTLLFWDYRLRAEYKDIPSGNYLQPTRANAAWLFQHATPGYSVGTSLMYWRKTWEANPFPEKNCGEDLEWLRDQVGYGNSASVDGFFKDEPAMVAEIHGGNTTVQTIPGDSWTRKPEWDERLKELMKL